MEKNKKMDATKKLQNLVKNRKTPIVILKQNSLKLYKRASSNGSSESYSYSDYNT